MTEPEGNSFKFCLPRKTLRFEGNKINCFPRDQSSGELLYSWKFIKPRCIAFCNVTHSEILTRNGFIVRCHVTFEVTNEIMHCWKTISSYVTMTVVNIDHHPTCCM